jgi:hypothetical protein
MPGLIRIEPGSPRLPPKSVICWSSFRVCISLPELYPTPDNPTNPTFRSWMHIKIAVSNCQISTRHGSNVGMSGVG